MTFGQDVRRKSLKPLVVEYILNLCHMIFSQRKRRKETENIVKNFSSSCSSWGIEYTGMEMHPEFSFLSGFLSFENSFCDLIHVLILDQKVFFGYRCAFVRISLNRF